jgi:predicted MFS family arabinose efflux permease
MNPQSQTMPEPSEASPWKTVTLSSLGSALEYFDFVIYAVFAATISKEFFPSDSAVTSLFNTFLVFAGGYIMRPIGGVFFSHIGDRFGRKPAFLASMLLMSFTMIAMALVPNTAHWGLGATVLFTLLRLLQGLSIGGEVPSAITYVVESVPRRGVTGCGLIMGAMAIGVLAATGTSAALTSLLPAEYLALAWRLAFVVGGLLGVCSYFLRRKLLETQALEHHVASEESLPFVELLRAYPGRVVTGIGIAAVVAIYSALLYAYLPAYLVRVLGYDAVAVSSSMMVCLVVGPIATVLMGMLGDIYPPHLIHRLGSSIALVGAIPAFNMLVGHQGNLTLILVTFALIGSFMIASHAWILADIFPKRVRCTGIAVAYNISFAVFGGFTPVIVTGLIASSGNNAIPGAYLAVVAAIAVAASFVIPKFAGNLRPRNPSTTAALAERVA